ncbi:hypothetical protein SAMN04487897_101839 [Paenibacillus sp. yr247]|uniref:hypothetical protein n=1 Tax=Paenibacillus sp. yr247 TaxID=1761880 RepID=UPI00087EA7EB|nr:hypothetical protein [Paenibacillus sp. yr247]SDN02845.1 hypothetical protein SAMN04487897_101839 [Paenibacillus sp. yr247]
MFSPDLNPKNKNRQMLSASIYFNDPDGNSLELISFLEDEPQILDHVPYLSEWVEMNKTIKRDSRGQNGGSYEQL